MADDPVPSTPPGGDASASAQDQPAASGASFSSAGTPPKRRRRRKRKPSHPPSVSGLPFDQIAATDVNTAQDEAEEAMDQPRASVQAMEEEAEERSVSSFSVSIAPEEKKRSEDLVYEAPVYQPSDNPAPPLPSSSFPPSTPTEQPPVAPPSDVVPMDPFGAYESPFAPSTPQTAVDPFAPVDPFAFSPSTPAPAPAPSAYESPFGPAPAPATPPVSSDEPSPYDLAASFSSGPSPFDKPLDDVSAAPLAIPQAHLEEPVEGELLEPLSVSSEASVPDASSSQHEGFSQRLRVLLAEANLTPRHLKFCCGGLLGIAGIIFFAVLLLPRLLSGDAPPPTDSSQTDQTDAQSPVSPTLSDSDAVPSTVVSHGQSWVDPSVYNGLLIGENPSAVPSVSPVSNAGLETGLLTGESSSSSEFFLTVFQKSVQELEGLHHLYFVDIQSLLDGSNDRAAALDDHIQTLSTAYQSGTATHARLGEFKARLKEEFDADAEAKEAAEDQFFVALEAFDEVDAEALLLEFVVLKQHQVDLKAKFLAFDELEFRYETHLKALFPLIEDLKVNREALISGVQVVDVLNSDLNLILSESDLEE